MRATHDTTTRSEFLAATEATGPAKVSLFRLLLGYRPEPLERWSRLRDEHGPVARYQMGLADTFFVSHPEGVKRVLQDNAANYTKEHGAYAMLRRLVGNGLLTSEGSFWLRQRRLAQPAFHRQKIAAMAGQMTATATQVGDEWSRRPGEPISMVREMSRLTLRVVGDALFGTALASQTAVVSQAWEVLNTQLVERFAAQRLLPAILPTRYDRAFRVARRTMHQVVESIIAERRSRPSAGDDLLSMLMAARDEDTGEVMTDGQLRDEVITMMIAGHETTALALCWCWALLARHPAQEARLQEELRQVLGGRAPAADDVPRLRFTRAVVDEALRLYPPAYIFFRRVKSDDVICGRRVHSGGTLVIAPMAIHRHPEFWPRPDEFVPERWLDAEAERARPRFAYLPFSGGPRQCIGNSFALMEAVLLLSTLAQRFQLRLVGELPEPEYLLTLHPSGGLPMVVSPRGDADASVEREPALS